MHKYPDLLYYTFQFVACLGVSEPGGGSDVAACQTTAKRVGDDLVINGQKMWITNAFQADWMCLLANTQEGPGMKHEYNVDIFGELITIFLQPT